jgi:hypothetical protein
MTRNGEKGNVQNIRNSNIKKYDPRPQTNWINNSVEQSHSREDGTFLATEEYICFQRS